MPTPLFSVENCKVLEMCPSKIMRVLPDYEGYSILLKQVNNENIKVIKTEFSNNVCVELAIKQEFYDVFKAKLIDNFNGKIIIEDLDCGYYPFG